MTSDALEDHVAQAIYEAFPPRRFRSDADRWAARPWAEAPAYWREACLAEARAAIKTVRKWDRR